MKPLQLNDLLDKERMSRAEMDAELLKAKAWRIQHPGIGLFVWDSFRDAFGKLSVREKLRPSHWQRELEWLFLGPAALSGLRQDEAIIARVITDLMNDSRAWCNPKIGVDDEAAHAALRKAFDQLLILAAKDSTDTDAQSEDSGQLSQPVDVESVEARRARTDELLRECAL